MIPLHVFTSSSAPDKSRIVIDGTVDEFLEDHPSFSHDFTVYVWDLSEVPEIPSYIKPFIIISSDAYPYTTTLVDVVYSIFPNKGQKFAAYRRPVRNTVPLYFYQVNGGVKVSQTQLDLPNAMDLPAIFVTLDSHMSFAKIHGTCTPVQTETSRHFTDSFSTFAECVASRAMTQVATETNPTTTHWQWWVIWLLLTLLPLLLWIVVSSRAK